MLLKTMTRPKRQTTSIGRWPGDLFHWSRDDLLDFHVHDAKSNHGILVMRGRVRVEIWPAGTTHHQDQTLSNFIHGPDTYIDLIAGQPHRITAITDAATWHPLLGA